MNKYEWKKTVISTVLGVPVVIVIFYIVLLMLSIIFVEANSHSWNAILFQKYNSKFITEFLPAKFLPICFFCGMLSIFCFWVNNLFSRRITEHLYVKLRNSDKFIYVKGKPIPNQIFFFYSLLLEEEERNGNLSVDGRIEEMLGEDHENQDAIMAVLSNKMKELNGRRILRLAETLLKQWVESDYDTKLFHCAFAFSLLYQLVIAGDLKARKVYLQEIKKRFQEGNLDVQLFLARSGHFSKLPYEKQVESWQHVREPEKLFSLCTNHPVIQGNLY